MLYGVRGRLAQPELRWLDKHDCNMPLDAVNGDTESLGGVPRSPPLHARTPCNAFCRSQLRGNVLLAERLSHERACAGPRPGHERAGMLPNPNDLPWILAEGGLCHAFTREKSPAQWAATFVRRPAWLAMKHGYVYRAESGHWCRASVLVFRLFGVTAPCECVVRSFPRGEEACARPPGYRGVD